MSSPSTAVSRAMAHTDWQPENTMPARRADTPVPRGWSQRTEDWEPMRTMPLSAGLADNARNHAGDARRLFEGMVSANRGLGPMRAVACSPGAQSVDWTPSPVARAMPMPAAAETVRARYSDQWSDRTSAAITSSPLMASTRFVGCSLPEPWVDLSVEQRQCNHLHRTTRKRVRHMIANAPTAAPIDVAQPITIRASPILWTCSRRCTQAC